MTCSTNECGTGLGSVILPSDPSNNSVISATPAFGGIDVSWTMPSTNPHAVAYVKLYRGILPDFDASLLIASAGGSTYFDRSVTSTALRYYYFIQVVSVNGTIGAPIGPASAVARPTIDDVMQVLSNQIEYGQLSTALKNAVDVAPLLHADANERMQIIQDEQLNIRELLVIQSTELNEAFILIDAETQARLDAQSAYASQVNTLAVQTAENFAAIQQTLQTSIDDVTDTVNALYTVRLTAENLVGGFGLGNNGASVEAGFDVDTFWVGRTQTDKKKPFIIQNGEVFIDTAVIKDASIDAAKIGSINLVGTNNFNVKTGSSGARMEMTNSGIKIYDSTGALRVKIGDLSA